MPDEGMVEVYVTFGVQYAREEHPNGPQFHPDGYLVVEAPDYWAARWKANRVLRRRWAFMYPEPIEEQFAPRGETERWKWTPEDQAAWEASDE